MESYDQKTLIYQRKTDLIRWLYERGYVVGLSAQKQVMECWHTRDYLNGWADECPKCEGTNIYRQTILVCFDVEVFGDHYRWHQPLIKCVKFLDSSDRAMIDDLSDVPVFTSIHADFRDRLTRSTARLYLAAIDEFLGVKRPGIWPAIRMDIQSIKNRYLFWSSFRVGQVKRAIRDRLAIEDSGISEDEIPF
jgi:hypothetical protein